MTFTGGFEPESDPTEPQRDAEPAAFSAEPPPADPAPADSAEIQEPPEHAESQQDNPEQPHSAQVASEHVPSEFFRPEHSQPELFPSAPPANADLIPPAQVYSAWPTTPAPFESWANYTEPPVRTPHFGHLAVLALLLFIGVLASSVLIRTALHFHLYGVTAIPQAMTEIHYTLGSEVVLYLVTLAGCLLVFPLIWHRSFFSGIQWNAATALARRNSLFIAAFACFVIALLNGVFMPGPENAPIDKIFRAPGAAWLLFAFGVTFAPFFEELFFRGFLLPALCTLCDWTDESIFSRPNLDLSPRSSAFWSAFAMSVVPLVLIGTPAALYYAIAIRSALLFLLILPIAPAIFVSLYAIRSPQASTLIRPLHENGHPRWTLPAMIIGSICTSLPFALMHAAQTGYSVGPLILLVGVSLVLCWIRLATRSLAASVLVHASYNFLLFSFMMLGTEGFRHLDKM